MRYLMTHSLLSSWLHALKENPYEDMTTERDPMAEFMQTLRREPMFPTEAMQNGIDFENLVTDIIRGQAAGTEQWYEAAAKIANHLRGGVLQYKAYKTISVGGMTLLLHGRLDCLKAGEITDVKFTKSYDPGKFFDSTQHPMYFEIVQDEHIKVRKMPQITDEPIIRRVFVSPMQSVLRHLQIDEKELVVRVVNRINAEPVGSYVFSCGKNMGAFKAVGFPEDVGRYYRLEEYEAYCRRTGRFLP